MIPVENGGSSWIPGFWAAGSFPAAAESAYVEWCPQRAGLSSHVEGPHLPRGAPQGGASMLDVFLKSRHGEEDRPEAVDYPRLRIRSKPFPWEDGNHILVHNPRVNLLPTGYEDE